MKNNSAKYLFYMYNMMNMGNMMNSGVKIHYKFRKLSNLKTNLNEKYTAKFYIFETLHRTIMFQFNLMAFNWQMKGNYFSLYLIACKFRPSAKNSNIEINI